MKSLPDLVVCEHCGDLVESHRLVAHKDERCKKHPTSRTSHSVDRSSASPNKPKIKTVKLSKARERELILIHTSPITSATGSSVRPVQGGLPGLGKR